jgi:hypothetical protein
VAPFLWLILGFISLAAERGVLPPNSDLKNDGFAFFIVCRAATDRCAVWTFADLTVLVVLPDVFTGAVAAFACDVIGPAGFETPAVPVVVTFSGASKRDSDPLGGAWINDFVRVSGATA